MDLTEYRTEVCGVSCSLCGARPGQPCWKAPRPEVGTFETTEDTFTPVAYVHDDRSLAYHLSVT